jgi:proteasome assembly chaperone (PAC2) family protein
MNTIEKRCIVTADNADIYAKIEVRFVVNSETKAKRLAAILSCGFNNVEVVDDCTGEVMFTKYYYWKPRKSPEEVLIAAREILDNE